MFDTILLATCLLATDVLGVATNPCDDQYDQQELYYFGGNATVFNKTWRFDPDTSNITEDMTGNTLEGKVIHDFSDWPVNNPESLCYGECFEIFQSDALQSASAPLVDHDPTVYSPPIDVDGYWDIHIIYATSALSLGAASQWNFDYEGSAPNCTVRYSTDSTLWTVIAVTHAQSPPQHIQSVTESLTADVAATVELSFSVYSDPGEIDLNTCFWDEIRICGTLITPAPTVSPSSQPSAVPTTATAAPTTAVPTTAAPTEDSGNGVDRIGYAMTVVSVVFAVLFGNM